MAQEDKDKEEKKTVTPNAANSGPTGEQTRPVDAFAGKGSLADKLKEERQRKAKRLKEIMGKNK